SLLQNIRDPRDPPLPRSLMASPHGLRFRWRDGVLSPAIYVQETRGTSLCSRAAQVHRRAFHDGLFPPNLPTGVAFAANRIWIPAGLPEIPCTAAPSPECPTCRATSLQPIPSLAGYKKNEDSPYENG